MIPRDLLLEKKNTVNRNHMLAVSNVQINTLSALIFNFILTKKLVEFRQHFIQKVYKWYRKSHRIYKE